MVRYFFFAGFALAFATAGRLTAPLAGAAFLAAGAGFFAAGAVAFVAAAFAAGAGGFTGVGTGAGAGAATTTGFSTGFGTGRLMAWSLDTGGRIGGATKPGVRLP